MNDRPFYTRVALVGVGMYLFIAALILVATLILEPSSVVFPIVVGVVALIVGAIIYFIQPWGLIIAVLGGLFGLLFSSDSIAINLSSPQSFFNFAFNLFTLVGAIILLAGGIMGLVQHFKHGDSTASSPKVVMTLKGVLGIVVVLSVISAVLTVAGLGGVSAADKQGATLLTAKKSDYDLDAISANSSGTTKIVIKNEDPVLHTFTIEELGIDVVVGPGTEKLVELKSPAAGSYTFFCKVSGHRPAMEGTVTVR